MRWLWVLALAAGVAAGQQTSLDVPLEKQRVDGCGAAVAAMVMSYWARQFPEALGDMPDNDAIYHALYSREDHGVRSGALQKYLEQHGYRVFAFAGTRDDLEEQIRKGRPVIVSLRDGNLLHYVVVRGTGEQAVWMNDPADGKAHRADWKRFTARWKGAAYWMLVAVPRRSSVQ